MKKLVSVLLFLLALPLSVAAEVPFEVERGVGVAAPVDVVYVTDTKADAEAATKVITELFEKGFEGLKITAEEKAGTVNQG